MVAHTLNETHGKLKLLAINTGKEAGEYLFYGRMYAIRCWMNLKGDNR